MLWKTKHHTSSGQNLGSLWNIHWMIWTMGAVMINSINSIPQVLGPFPHPFPPTGSNARNFSNSCVTDDNIAVLLRMPNVILTPHLAFFTKETILRSWLLTVQTRQTHKKRKIWTDPKSSHNHYRNCGFWLPVLLFWESRGCTPKGTLLRQGTQGARLKEHTQWHGKESLKICQSN